MTNPPETPGQAATGNDDVFAIPIDRGAAKKYYSARFCVIGASIGVPFFTFLLLVSFGAALLLFVFFAIGVAVTYALFAKWLIEWQVDALQYRIEGRTLRVDSGVFFLKRKGVPLDRITDFALVQGPLMRLLGIWALQVQTAGVGTPTPEATLIAIENPEQVRDELLRRRDAAAQGNRRDYA
jgi:putative membrane protein